MESISSSHLSKPAPRIALTIWMIVTQLLSIGSLIPWLLLLVVSIAFQDSPNGPSFSFKIFLIFFYLYPLFPISMMIVAWISFAKRKNWLAIIFSTLTIIPLMIFLLYFYNVL